VAGQNRQVCCALRVAVVTSNAGPNSVPGRGASWSFANEIRISVTPPGRGGTWSGDGTILFTPDINSPIERVSASGGTPVAVTKLSAAREQTNHRWPQFLPDGQHFIFFSNSSNPDYAGTYVSSLQGGEAKFILKGSSNAIYASGHLLFADGGNLMVQVFDLNQLKLVGDPTAIEDKVGVIDVSARALITASANNVLA
jgi:hypothetical protein